MNTGWDAYAPFRNEFTALCPERYPPAYIDAQVLSCAWQCWSDGKAAILAEIRTYPSGLKEVHGLAAAGELESVIGLIPLAESYGRHVGCTLASIESRDGWGRLLPDYAAEQTRIVKGLN